MLILAIETSCDETAAAVIGEEGGKMVLLSNIVSSQVALHAAWGGVVPNLAAREHLKNILPVIQKTLKKARVAQSDISAIAVTGGPGLIPALLIGVGAAKTLSYFWGVPLLGIHHIEGHIYANFLPIGRKEVSEVTSYKFPASTREDDRLSTRGGQITGNLQNSNDKKNKREFKEDNKLVQLKSSAVEFPALCLVVSGGHTQLVLMKKHLHYKIIGETVDDAVGEAFDKVARILKLGYPGGPAVAAAAANHKKRKTKSKKILDTKYQIPNTTFILPRPMINSGDFNFSFSGLKTAVLYLVKKNEDELNDENFKSAVAAEFQQAAVDVLIKKTLAAAEKYKIKTVMLAGGVSANRELRRQLKKAIKENIPDAEFQVPEIKFTGDNAAMIGAAAYFRWHNIPEKNKKEWDNNWKNLEAAANLKLKS